MLGFICFGSLVAQHPSLQIKDGKVNYLIDERGNRVLDYSYCGYKSSGQDIPVVKNVVFVPWKEGDNSLRIQKAIDYASSLKPDVEGFRGAVLLDKGTFVLENDLYLHTSGVVLRGMDSRETVLLKKGVDRGALLYIEGIDDRTFVDTIDISSAYVPVNNRWLEVNSGCSLLKKDDRVLIVRPSTKEWIASVACTEYGGGISALGWKPGDIDIWWDRTVTGVIDGKIEIDSPLSMALDSRYAHSKLVSYTWKGRIENVGVENMTLISDYDKRYPKDEDHCWTGISVENAENCWIRKLFFRHFSGSAVILQPTSSKITVEDCISTQPVSEIGGMRRCTFLTMGQLNLFQRCYSEHGIHDFSAGYCAAGPNAFVQCESYESFGFSGSIDSWACGLLFDIVNIDGHNLSYKNLGQDKNGAGWNTANSTFWQCTAAGIECFSPAEDAKNRAYGCWAQFSGDGEWAESNNHIEPRSLFYAQLNERLNKDCSLRARILPKELEATSSPTVELAMELAQKAFIPKLTLRHWIEQASVDEQLISVVQVKNIDELKRVEGRAFIIVVDRAVNDVVKHGINFDAIITVDAGKSIEYMNNEESYKYPIFACDDAKNELLELNKGRKIFLIGTAFMNKICKKYGIETKHYSVGGSVATSAFNMARVIGSKKIILVGQDLAYAGELTHAGGEKEEHVINNKTFMVEGIDGKEVKTRGDWLRFLKWYETEIEKLDEDVEVIDATEGGAKIAGTKVMKLSEVIDKYCTVEFDFKKALDNMSPAFDEKKYPEVRQDLFHLDVELSHIKECAKKGIEISDLMLCEIEKGECDLEAVAGYANRIKEMNKLIEEQFVYNILNEYIKADIEHVMMNVNCLGEDEIENKKETCRISKFVYEKILDAVERIEPLLKDSLERV